MVEMPDVLAAFEALGFTGPTWARHRVLTKVAKGLPLDASEVPIFQYHTGRTVPPTTAPSEILLLCGRRTAKSRWEAFMETTAALRDYRGLVAPGERVTIPMIAPDRKQARTLKRYVEGMLAHPALAPLVIRRTAESITLQVHGIEVVIEIHTANFKLTRGYTFGDAAIDEGAFLPSDSSASPDTELAAALRPGLATIPGAQLLIVSTPYAKRGLVYDLFARYWGQDDARVLVWKGTTLEMNPTVDPALIEDALAADEPSARAEYFAEFRSDLESFVALEALVAITIPGRLELPPRPGVRYIAFKDPAGGSGQDADAVAIAHAEVREGRVVGVLDCVRFSRRPFSPSAVTAEHAALLKSYGMREVTGDRFAGSWPAEAFTTHGITYRPSELTKGAIYQATLPLINSAQLEWLDLPTLRTEALGLERRTAWGGRDSINHAPHGHDDVVNVVAGACLLAVTGQTHAVTPAAMTAWGESMDTLTRESPWRADEHTWRTPR
jgi:hypothetical protein